MGKILEFRPRKPKEEEKKYVSFTVSKKPPVVTEKTFTVMTPNRVIENATPTGVNAQISAHLNNEALYSAFLDTLRDIKPTTSGDSIFQRSKETIHVGQKAENKPPSSKFGTEFPNLVVEIDYPDKNLIDSGWIVSYAFFGVTNPKKKWESTLFVKRPRIDVSSPLWIKASPPMIVNILDVLGRIATLSHIEVEQSQKDWSLDVSFVEYAHTKIRVLITRVIAGEAYCCPPEGKNNGSR